MRVYAGVMGRKLAPRVTPYKRADGTTTYRVRLRVNDRQTTETFESEAAAKVFALQVADPAIGPAEAVRIRNTLDRAQAEYIPTVREALASHIENLTGVDPRTKEDYLKVAGRTWLPILGSLPVTEVSRTHVAKFVNAMDGTLAPKSIKNAHSILSAVLENALRDGFLTNNPARGTRLPRSGEENVGENRYLTHAEFDRLYEATPPHYRPFVVTLFGTGLRFSEATALQVQDIDLSAETLRVVRAWKRDDQGMRIGHPKSRASRRTIALPYEVGDALAPLLDRPGSAWLFTTATGLHVRHANFYNRIWVPACKAAELDPRPRIHDARHSHASWLIARGIRLEVIQDRLGHEDYTTTRKVYGHLLPDMRREAGLAASEAFASTSLRSHPNPQQRLLGGVQVHQAEVNPVLGQLE